MIKSHLAHLIAEKAKQENRKLSYRTVAKETGISYSTISRLARNEVTRYTDVMLSSLCGYLACSVGDLLEYEPRESQ
jgi:DNA-binding Xre family transcriptional regulator